MNIPTSEQETIINFTRDENGATVFTTDRTVMTKLDKRVADSPHYSILKNYKDESGDVYGCEYKIDDKSLISFRGAKRELSEEQKQSARERFIQIRNSQNSLTSV